jgi:hypothetical protein
MNETKSSGHSPDNVHRSHRPYWKRAHRDWRIWFCVIVMLIAMFVYVATDGFGWQIQGKPQSRQPISAPGN